MARLSSGWMTAGLASRGRRLLSAAVAILIGVGFLAASLVVLATATAGIEESVAGPLRSADLVVTRSDEWLPTEDHDALAALDEVAAVRGETSVGAERTAGAGSWVYGAPLPATGVTLLRGALPEGDGQVLASTQLADAAGVEVGDELTVQPAAFDETARPDPVTLRVAGVAEFSDAHPMLAYGETFAASDATLRMVDPALSYQSVSLDLAGDDVDAAREAVAAAVPGATVQTGAEAAAARVAAMTGTGGLGAVLVGFGAVALLTAAIVIANTFTITLAQRTGELALLRCVGATRGQVRRQVLLEAVVLGLLASVLGVLAGVGAAAGLLALGRRLDLGLPLDVALQVDVVALLVPVLVGTVVTVLASLWPAVRATRVSPLAALRPGGTSSERHRVGWVRIGLAVVLVGAGTAAMVYAATEREMLAGVAGGFLSFLGVLVAAVVVVPVAVRALGLGARAAGVPGRLAVDNAVRNPGRAAATSAALVVGVTLITMTSVGAATAQRTALDEIDQAYAVDVLLTTGSEDRPGAQNPYGPDGDLVPTAEDLAANGVLPVELDASVPGRVAAVQDVAAVTPVQTAYVVIGDSWSDTPAVGLDPATAGETVRSTALVEGVRPGTVGLNDLSRMMLDLEPGDTVAVTGSAGSAELTVTDIGLGSTVVLHPDTLAELAGDDVRTGGVLVRLADGADLGAALAGVRDVADDAALAVGGAAVERAMIVQVLDVLVLVTTALLGAAVVIAVVGIANTLSLSVLERHREHALLRGLGLTRGQMRGMLLTEGVLLALVSAGLGLALGTGYAALGVQTLLPEDTAVQLTVPWLRVGVIVGVALLAGVLASVLPARRATRVSPAEGLAAA